VIQQLAAEMNLTLAFDYGEFLNHWDKENKDRKVKKNAGEVVYGPVLIDKRSYYDYLFSNLEIRLKNKLNKEIFVPSENELKAHYDLMKQEFFLYAPIMPLEYLLLDESQLTEIKSNQLVEEAKRIVQNGQSLESIGKKNIVWTYRKVDLIDSVASYGEENPVPRLKELALHLDTKALSVLKIDYQLYLLRLTRPLELSLRPFKEVKDLVLFDYQKQKFNELIKQRINEAQVEKNDKIYEAISID